MNKQKITLGFSLVFLATAVTSFAAGITLTNGGLGQVANNPLSFGVAVCNGGTATVTQSVPIDISVNGAATTVSSPSPLAAGACGYSYVDYSQLNMAGGQNYEVTVTIDPGHTVMSANNQASYSITVPQVTASATGTTQVAVEHVGFLANIGSFFANFFATLKNLF
jgi:hypothetical protein